MDENKIYVIGSNGGVGAAIVDELLSKGYKNIIGITISGKEKYGRDIKVIQADATKVSELEKVIENPSIIFGAFNGSEYTSKAWGVEFPAFMKSFVNIGKKTKAKLVFIDNLYTYKDTLGKTIYDENSEVLPKSEKGKIRKEVADMFIKSLNSNEIDGVIVRGSDLYGPYSLNSLIGDRYFEGIFTKGSAEILPLGNKLHSFTFSRDFAKVALIAATTKSENNILHVPNINPIGYLDLIQQTYKYIDSTPKENKIPLLMFRIVSLFMPPVKSILEMYYMWENDFIVQSRYLKDFKPTKLEDGLKETVSWFKSYLTK